MLPLYDRKSLYLLALTIAVGGFLYFQLGFFAKHMLEHYASQVAGADVDIGYMKIDAVNKVTVMKDVTLENPLAYKKQAQYAVKVKEIVINTDALLTGLAVFNDIRVDGIEVFLVADADGSNFAVFQQNIMKHREDFFKNYDDDESSPPDIAIEHLGIINSRLTPIITDVDKKLEPIVIPDIEMKDVGTRESGVRTTWAIAQVWRELTNGAIAASSDAGLLNNLPAFHLDRLEGIPDLQEAIPSRVMKSLFGRRY